MSYEICDGKEVIAVDQVSNEQAIAWHDVIYASCAQFKRLYVTIHSAGFYNFCWYAEE